LKLITRDTDYALRAICYIAKHKSKIVSVSELTKELGISRPFLRKILQILNQKGILHSYKGSKGGFNLSKQAANIFLMDLIDIFQGPFSLNKCSLSKKKCPQTEKCPLRKKIESIESYVVDELKSVNIASLSKGING